jgi:protein-S-isoprenylcysteine O-methyltransferase Ste14
MDKPLSAHIKAFILPVIMLVVLPVGLDLLEFHLAGRPLMTRELPLLLAGGIIGLGGGVLLVASIRLIIVYANTTVMPWVPSEHLVVRGPYRTVRNPMILGVVLVMLSEGLILESVGTLCLALIFFLGNTLYFILREEPELARRFGTEYDRYCANVRRWWPRLRPWEPDER